MKRILIVDDAATIRLYYRTILEGAGFGVAEAVNGIEALEKAFQEEFDLFVVDINMPKMDGYGFLRTLRGSDLPQVPAIMVSTESADGDRSQSYRSGANFYLIKPVKPDRLLNTCRLLLGEVSP
jgi:two-component system, chemotaxis family, chemotaxis protein CheY